MTSDLLPNNLYLWYSFSKPATINTQTEGISQRVSNYISESMNTEIIMHVLPSTELCRVLVSIMPRPHLSQGKRSGEPS